MSIDPESTGIIRGVIGGVIVSIAFAGLLRGMCIVTTFYNPFGG